MAGRVRAGHIPTTLPRGAGLDARSTTFHGRPGNLDAGIAFGKIEAGPMLDKIEGWRGLSMLFHLGPAAGRSGP